jgi:glucokinase
MKSEKRHWVGFDLGGTKMLAVVYDDKFHPIARARKRTRGEEGAKEGLQRMIKVIESALAEAQCAPSSLAGIGIGCPGPLDLDRGIALELPNLGWRKTKIKATLEDAFKVPVHVLNDVDAGTYGEYRFGAAKHGRCVLGVFPGTGIGGGAIYEGRILRGKTGSCMEIGHIPVEAEGPLCGCGQKGCLEAIAGRLAISTQVAAAAYRGDAPSVLASVGTDVREIRSRVLSDAIAAGDKAVEDIVRNAARRIGWAIAGVVNLLAPDIIILGGGMVEDMPDLFKGEIEASTRARVMPSFRDTFQVSIAKLNGDASVVGAAGWAEANTSA